MFLPALLALQIGTPPISPVPVRPIAQLIHTTWTPKAGGSPGGIRHLAQTTDGYLWIGSFFGLWRFDGVRFVRYTPLEGDSIPEGPVLGMLATRDGGLWMIGGGTGGVLTRQLGGRVTVFNPGKETGLGLVLSIAESSKRLLVVGTVDGLSRFSDGKWESVDAAWGFPAKLARAVWFDRDDGLWVVTEDSVLYLPVGATAFVDPGIPVKKAPVDYFFAQEKDGTVWLATEGVSVRTLRKSGAQRPPEVELDALSMMIDRGGSLWIASGSDGLWRIPDLTRVRGRSIRGSSPEVEHYRMKDGLLTDIPTALLHDREGNIWVGSSNGLEQFRMGAFTPTLTAGPARPRYIISDRDSSVWTAPYGLGVLQRIGPRGQELFDVGFPTWNIAPDPSGRPVVAMEGHLRRLEGKRFVPVPLRPGAAQALYAVAMDPAGNVWIQSEKLGLLRLDGDRLTKVANTLGPVQHSAQPFSDSKGTIWVGQADRVYRYEGGKLTVYGKPEGIYGFIYQFFEDKRGTIWVANGDGLSRFKGDGFETLKRKGAIPGMTVFGLAQSDDDAWWLATMPGILRFPPGEIERAMAESTYVPRFRSFDESDGMLGALVKGYWGPILAKSADGKIWVATDSGLASIDPRVMPVAEAPPVTLEVARIQGREVAISDGVELAPGTSDMEIDYTSLAFSTPERIQYRYRLEGSDTAWHTVGDRRRAYYTGLAPGSYRFQVSASYGDGTWNDAGASWSFRVLPEWYETWWLKALVVLAIGGVAGSVVALIQRNRHARAQRALQDRHDATLAERVRIAQDLHDTLLQSITGISLQLTAAEHALPDRPDIAAGTLTYVQELTRWTIREAREQVLGLHQTEEEETDLAQALEAAAVRLAANTGITIAVMTRGTRRRLPRALEATALLIGREAIANAVRHAKPTRIEVLVGFEQSSLLLEVRDNGIGFTAEQAELARRRGHLGLTGMSGRATRAGGRCAARPSDSGGTVVEVALPIP